MKKLILIFALLGLSACAHSIHQAHTSDFMPGSIESGRMVKGYGEQFVVMGFASETNYVNQAFKQLTDSCPNGYIASVTTQYSTSLGFFSWTNKILMQGLCMTPKKS